MINSLVTFALENRFLILVIALLVFAWGAVSFHRFPWKPTRTWPTTTWRLLRNGQDSAEQVEQQVAIPLEIVMNGIPGGRSICGPSRFSVSPI